MNSRFLTSVFLVGFLAVISSPQAADAKSDKPKDNTSPAKSNNPALLATCAVTDVTLGGGSANACYGQILGNDVGNSPNNVNLLELLNGSFAPPNFAVTGTWLSAGTEIQNGNGTSGLLTSSANSGLLTGNWTLTLNNNDLIEALVISVKGGNGWSAYFFNPSTLANSFSGAWSTLGLLNGGGNQPELSHISAYYVKGQQPPTPIPTPALLPGLIGMGLAAMRKKKAAQEKLQEQEA